MVEPALDQVRYRLDLEYDGTHFAGWQVQPGERTVQGVVEEILGRVLGAAPRVTGAGRTDRGCHAAQQVAHFDAPAGKRGLELARALRALLPADIRLTRFSAAAPDFHARYAAIERAYVYLIGRRRSVFRARFRWDLGCRLHFRAMRQASAGLKGAHDFRAYAIGDGGEETGEPRSGICRVRYADWDVSEGAYRFTIVADRFLTRMVRLLVGAMVEVGAGEGDPDPGRVAARLGGPPPDPRPAAAPASGLTLAWVRYAGEPEARIGRVRPPARGAR
jgi:tRNA pseudouridine38-40 synthase